MDKGKYLGIDFGDRRVGIALSDLNKEIAFPREVLVVLKLSELLEELKLLCETEGVTKIVLGLPLDMNGNWGDRAQKTEVFRQKLEKAVPGIDIEYFDERLTSVEAEKSLREQGYKNHRQKDKKDAVAAQKILQTYLDSRR
ncbi:Holliday junction resolvase RuvX [Candidatus Peregrinibacteria bacterium]|nr:Holliday junction resolvase RuvX [Candidatus Peregrinibacteria bacterium]